MRASKLELGFLISHGLPLEELLQALELNEKPDSALKK
jgi:hypothetical protein